MKVIAQLERLDRLSTLIRRKSTGPPDELARKLGVSRSTVFNLLNELECLGAEITYCRERRSYVFEVEITIKFEVIS
ncbi:MAG TPA: HTH domain-containing protein [Phaeodactylibacter sp.]|nr:HTH domain-containing protein [Phaeodactylibacter sp.]